MGQTFNWQRCPTKVWCVPSAIHVPCNYRSQNKVLFLRDSITLFLSVSDIYKLWLSKCFFYGTYLFVNSNRILCKGNQSNQPTIWPKIIIFSNNVVYINGTCVKIQFLLHRERDPCSFRWLITLWALIMMSELEPGFCFDHPKGASQHHFACTFCYLGEKCMNLLL